MGNKKTPRCLTNIFAGIMLIILAGWGLKTCADRRIAPEIPERAEKWTQEALAKPEKINSESSEDAPKQIQEDAAKPEKNASETAPTAEKWRQEDMKQSARWNFIQKLVSMGVLHKVDFRHQAATIWVTPAFYLLDFDTKQSFCSVIYAYVSTKARSEIVAVTLKDRQSGKVVGDYGQQWTGFGLKMK